MVGIDVPDLVMVGSSPHDIDVQDFTSQSLCSPVSRQFGLELNHGKSEKGRFRCGF
jgi:hypothetical protein